MSKKWGVPCLHPTLDTHCMRHLISARGLASPKKWTALLQRSRKWQLHAWRSTSYAYSCEFAVLSVSSYGITAVMTALASSFQKRSLPLIGKLDEKVANCNNPALREELVSRIMWFLHRPIFLIVREYAGTKSEVRAHNKCSEIAEKSELSSHQMAPSGVVALSSSWTPAVCELHRVLPLRFFGLRQCVRRFRQCFVQQFLLSPPSPLFGTPEKFRIGNTFSEQRHLKLKISWPAQPAPGRKVSANLRSPHSLMRSWMTWVTSPVGDRSP